MLLTIDAGNTNTVFALFEGREIIEEWRLSTMDNRTVDEYTVWISHLMNLHGRSPRDVSGAIIASVVPQIVWPLTRLCEDFFKCRPLIVDKAMDLGVDIRIPNPAEVGADRLVNAVAADTLYDGPLAVVDFGTATTFDIVKDKAYLGGVICPGINLSLTALHQAAAKLPRIAVEPPAHDRVTGKSTLEAMQSGVFWGYVGMIEGLAGRLRREHGNAMRVLATGGLAPIFKARTEAIDAVVPDLTLQGLRLLYERNGH